MVRIDGLGLCEVADIVLDIGRGLKARQIGWI